MFVLFLSCYLFMCSSNVLFLERQCSSCILSNEGSDLEVCGVVIYFLLFF